MFITEDIKEKIKQLSILSRKVYGIREKEVISFKEHPKFVSDVIKDITNISYNLAIADHVSSEAEKELFLASKSKKIIKVEEGNHNNIRRICQIEYLRWVDDFINGIE